MLELRRKSELTCCFCLRISLSLGVGSESFPMCMRLLWTLQSMKLPYGWIIDVATNSHCALSNNIVTTSWPGWCLLLCENMTDWRLIIPSFNSITDSAHAFCPLQSLIVALGSSRNPPGSLHTHIYTTIVWVLCCRNWLQYCLVC